ncbi:MAG TPA: universal stress protein [Burkholderiaceae bacterium]|nr:universal stress protein [Burkholderiaceae bacterium]
MHRLLVPVDGSENALRAVGYAITVATERPNTEIHLLHVQEPMPSHVHAYFSAADIEKMGVGETEKILQPARRLCAETGVSCTAHFRIGPIAQTIADSAAELQCNVIVMGTRGMSPIANLIIGSVTAKVLHLASVPITVVK